MEPGQLCLEGLIKQVSRFTELMMNQCSLINEINFIET